MIIQKFWKLREIDIVSSVENVTVDLKIVPCNHGHEYLRQKTSPWTLRSPTKTRPCIASFLPEKLWKLRQIAIHKPQSVRETNISLKTNAAVYCKLSAGKNRGNYMKLPSMNPNKVYVKPTFHPRKTNAAVHCKLSAGKYRENYVKSPSKLSFARIVRCSSGLFRTFYSIAKSEGKSGSSESKQGNGNKR